MITIQDWEKAYHAKEKLYYWDGDKVTVCNPELFVRMFHPLHEFMTSNNVWFKDIYKSEKECAEAFIKSIQDMYSEKQEVKEEVKDEAE